MSTVAKIKAATARLTLEERAEVARCLHEWEDDSRDKQMQQDLATGKLDSLRPRWMRILPTASCTTCRQPQQVLDRITRGLRRVGETAAVV